MDKKEFRHLSRGELLDIIFTLRKNQEVLEFKNADLEEQLADRTIKIENAGSIAEASLAITKVFAEAQAAADIYLAEVHRLGEESASVKAHDARAKNPGAVPAANSEPSSELRAKLRGGGVPGDFPPSAPAADASGVDALVAPACDPLTKTQDDLLADVLSAVAPASDAPVSAPVGRAQKQAATIVASAEHRARRIVQKASKLAREVESCSSAALASGEGDALHVIAAARLQKAAIMARAYSEVVRTLDSVVNRAPSDSVVNRASSASVILSAAKDLK